jgi:hypothetical protein
MKRKRSKNLNNVFGIAVAVVVVVLKKLFYKKVLLVEIGLKKISVWLKLWLKKK